MLTFADALTLREARAQFFAANESVFGKDGGYDKKWIRVELGPIPIYYPNILGRDRAVRLHDLHHIVTGYSTQLVGEAEIGAWEVASGCGNFWHAWFLNMGAFTLGLFIAPRRMFRAFVRGLHSDNLYHHCPRLEDALLDDTVGETRERLRLSVKPAPANARDKVSFIWWTMLSAAVTALPWLIALGVVAMLVWMIFF